MSEENIKDIKVILLDLLSTNEEIRNKVKVIADKDLLSEIEGLFSEQNTRIMKISSMLDKNKIEKQVVETSEVVEEQKPQEVQEDNQSVQVDQDTDKPVENDVVMDPVIVPEAETNNTHIEVNEEPKIVSNESSEIITPPVNQEEENKVVPEVTVNEEIPVPEIPEGTTPVEATNESQEEITLPSVPEVDKTNDLLMTYVNMGTAEDRALLTSKHQITNLRASKKNQQALFDSISSNQTIESVNNESAEPSLVANESINSLVEDQQAEIENKLAEAERLYKEGKTEEAEKIYNEISELNSKLAEKTQA